jgi:hypothetical protein
MYVKSRSYPAAAEISKYLTPNSASCSLLPGGRQSQKLALNTHMVTQVR